MSIPMIGDKTVAADSVSEASVTERVAAQICEDVREGRLTPGQRLTEAQLTAQLRVSRGPVREALRRLEADGVLTFEKNRGVSVRRLNRDDFVHLLEVREALEALAARLAAGHPQLKAGPDRFTRLFEQMERAVERGDIERYNHALYVKFHALLVHSSDNPVLISHWQQLNLETFRQQFKPLVDIDLVRIAHREHAGLVAALRAQDPARAEQCARQHIKHFTEHVRRLPDRVFR